MKRLLIALLALGLLIAFAGPVGAKKPDGPVGLTCPEKYSNDPRTLLGVFSSSSGYTTLEFTLTKELSAACFDVTSGAGDWSMEVVGDAAPREMNVMIRDSAPGDFCGDAGYQVRSGIAVIGNWTFPDVPASAVDACGLGFDDHDPQLTFWLNARNLPRNETLTITVTVPPLGSS